jgi:hypothetical protein
VLGPFSSHRSHGLGCMDSVEKRLSIIETRIRHHLKTLQVPSWRARE